MESVEIVSVRIFFKVLSSRNFLYYNAFKRLIHNCRVRDYNIAQTTHINFSYLLIQKWCSFHRV